MAKTVLKSESPLLLQDLGERTGFSRSKLAEALHRLEDVAIVSTLPNGQVTRGEQAVDDLDRLDEVVEAAVQAHESYRQFSRSRIEMMRGYAELRNCRREYLLNYFGEELHAPCGFCDNCAAGITVEEDAEHLPFPINTCVRHTSWGEGMVLRYESDKMVVLFDEVGYKTLAVEIVTGRGLLEPVSA